MYCPRCAEPKAAEPTQFCTKCGLNLEELEAYVAVDRKRGLDKQMKQGMLLFVIGILFIPIYVFLGPLFPPNDVLVESSPSTTWFEQIVWTLMWLSFIAGAARIGIAYTFERRRIHASDNEKPLATLNPAPSPPTQHPLHKGTLAPPVPHERLLPEVSIPMEDMIGRWRTTGELIPERRKPRTSGEL